MMALASWCWYQYHTKQIEAYIVVRLETRRRLRWVIYDVSFFFFFVFLTYMYSVLEAPPSRWSSQYVPEIKKILFRSLFCAGTPAKCFTRLRQMYTSHMPWRWWAGFPVARASLQVLVPPSGATGQGVWSDAEGQRWWGGACSRYCNIEIMHTGTVFDF